MVGYGIVHTLLMHTGSLKGHTFPQKPQLLLSLERLTHVPEQSVRPGAQSVVDVVLTVVDEVVVDDADVVVVGDGQSPVARSHDWLEQQMLVAEHGLPVGVQHPQPGASGRGSQRSNCTGHWPAQFTDPQPFWSGTQ
jgi:hypothetical protein